MVGAARSAAARPLPAAVARCPRGRSMAGAAPGPGGRRRLRDDGLRTCTSAEQVPGDAGGVGCRGGGVWGARLPWSWGFGAPWTWGLRCKDAVGLGFGVLGGWGVGCRDAVGLAFGVPRK